MPSPQYSNAYVAEETNTVGGGGAKGGGANGGGVNGGGGVTVGGANGGGKPVEDPKPIREEAKPAEVDERELLMDRALEEAKPAEVDERELLMNRALEPTPKELELLRELEREATVGGGGGGGGVTLEFAALWEEERDEEMRLVTDELFAAELPTEKLTEENLELGPDETEELPPELIGGPTELLEDPEDPTEELEPPSEDWLLPPCPPPQQADQPSCGEAKHVAIRLPLIACA